MLKLVEFKPPDTIDAEWQYKKDLENNILYLEKYIGDGVGVSIPKTIEGEAKLYNPLTEKCKIQCDYKIDVRLAKDADIGNAKFLNIPVRYVIEYSEDEKIVLDADLDFKKPASLETVILRSCDVEQKCEAIVERNNTSSYFEKDTAEFFKKVKECLLENTSLKEIYLDFGKYYSKVSCEIFAENLYDSNISKITTNASEFTDFVETVKVKKLEESNRKISKAFFIKEYLLCIAIVIFGIVNKISNIHLLIYLIQFGLVLLLTTVVLNQLHELITVKYPESEKSRFNKTLALFYSILVYALCTMVMPTHLFVSFVIGLIIYFVVKLFSIL